MARIRPLVEWFDPRRRVIAIALAGWVLVIAFAARGDTGGTTWVRLPDLTGAFTVVMGITLVLCLVFVVVLRPRIDAAERRRRMTVRGLVALVALALVVAVVADDRAAPPPITSEQEVFVPVGDTEAEPEPAPTATDGSDLVALLGLVALAAAVLAWSRARSDSESGATGTAGPPEPSAFLPAVADATGLLRHGDPRTAVMAAYAALEQALATIGHPRPPSATPTEYVRHVLRTIPTLRDPAVGLAHLHELARFSEHAITEESRRTALTELERARASLREVSLP